MHVPPGLEDPEQPRRPPDARHAAARPSGRPTPVVAPVQASVAAVHVQVGQQVPADALLVSLESMKMEIPVEAGHAGTVEAIEVGPSDAVGEGQVLLWLRGAADGAVAAPARSPLPSAPLQPAGPADARDRGLERLHRRQARLRDEARPEATAARHARGRPTAREIVAHLAEPGSFVEHGALAVAAQRSRRTLDELERQTPADGLITGVARLRGAADLPVALMVYDYTVLAGTQGVMNHAKADRLLALAGQQGLPVLLWAEGGGGRPGDVDWPGVAGLDCTTFARLAALSGQVPLIGLVGGRCFAGNAALLGCCDLVVATRDSSIGMGGPAMIEGGGLGRVAADAVGPATTLAASGAVDVLVDDDRQALDLGMALLRAMRQHDLGPGAPPRQLPDTLRHAVPAGRHAAFDPSDVLAAVVDAGSWIELRASFGRAVMTGIARIGGRVVAVAASHSRHGAGALDAPACDKLARFFQLADARGWPLVTLVDTPGFMVGPESEAAGMLRHAARVFVTAAALRVPVISVVLRRGYGLGAMALTAGHFHAPVATAAWPTAEFGAMGIEGAVRLGFRKELEAAPPAEREALFRQLVQQMLDKGEALHMASHLEIDAVIDPAETRAWLLQVLGTLVQRPLPARRSFIDPW